MALIIADAPLPDRLAASGPRICPIPYVSVTVPNKLILPGALSCRASGITSEVVPINVAPKPILLSINSNNESLARDSSTQALWINRFAVRHGRTPQCFAAHSQPKQPGMIAVPTNDQRCAVSSGEPALSPSAANR